MTSLTNHRLASAARRQSPSMSSHAFFALLCAAVACAAAPMIGLHAAEAFVPPSPLLAKPPHAGSRNIPPSVSIPLLSASDPSSSEYDPIAELEALEHEYKSKLASSHWSEHRELESRYASRVRALKGAAQRFEMEQQQQRQQQQQEQERQKEQQEAAEREKAEAAEESKAKAEAAEAERIEAERKAKAEKAEAEAEAERRRVEEEAERNAAEEVRRRKEAQEADLRRMLEEQQQRAEEAAEKKKAARIAAEKAEADRIAAEEAEAERKAAEKAEAERKRKAAQEAEKQRIAAEKAEAERKRKAAEAERKALEEAEKRRMADAERKTAQEAEAAGRKEKQRRISDQLRRDVYQSAAESVDRRMSWVERRVTVERKAERERRKGRLDKEQRALAPAAAAAAKEEAEQRKEEVRAKMKVENKKEHVPNIGIEVPDDEYCDEECIEEIEKASEPRAKEDAAERLAREARFKQIEAWAADTVRRAGEAADRALAERAADVGRRKELRRLEKEERREKEKAKAAAAAAEKVRQDMMQRRFAEAEKEKNEEEDDLHDAVDGYMDALASGNDDDLTAALSEIDGYVDASKKKKKAAAAVLSSSSSSSDAPTTLVEDGALLLTLSAVSSLFNLVKKTRETTKRVTSLLDRSIPKIPKTEDPLASAATEEEQEVVEIPELREWKVRGISITGRVYNHPTLDDGDAIMTSPLTNLSAAKEGGVVVTTSGSEYRLGPSVTFGKGTTAAATSALDIPEIREWYIDGSAEVVGRVYGHADMADGDRIVTSPIAGVSAAREGGVVGTESGSRYRLGPRRGGGSIPTSVDDAAGSGASSSREPFFFFFAQSPVESESDAAAVNGVSPSLFVNGLAPADDMPDAATPEPLLASTNTEANSTTEEVDASAEPSSSSSSSSSKQEG